jgi:hypothetical protein
LVGLSQAEKQAEEERRREAELQAAKDRDTAAALVTEAQRIRYLILLSLSFC